MTRPRATDRHAERLQQSIAILGMNPKGKRTVISIQALRSNQLFRRIALLVFVCFSATLLGSAVAFAQSHDRYANMEVSYLLGEHSARGDGTIIIKGKDISIRGSAVQAVEVSPGPLQTALDRAYDMKVPVSMTITSADTRGDYFNIQLTDVIIAGVSTSRDGIKRYNFERAWPIKY